jgi:large subunit ribosomal protein L22
VPAVKTNEREGTRAVLRHSRTSAYKIRQVLDQIRGQDVDRAAEILDLGDRDAAVTVAKVLASAVANAVHNDRMDAEELYVSACYADEGTTLKRWRPRARGRATRIRKRTSHITIIVSRLPEDRIARRRTKQAANTAQRSRRVAGSRRRQQTESAAPPVEADEGATGDHDEMLDESIDDGIDVTETGETEVDETDVDETGVDETDVDETDVDETDETEVDAEEEETDGTEAGAGVAAEDTGSGGDEEEPDGKIADEQDEKGK